MLAGQRRFRLVARDDTPGIDLNQVEKCRPICLILFVIALALAPLWHFLPSKGQRKAARMREHAAVQGLFVEFRELPGAAKRSLSCRQVPEV